MARSPFRLSALVALGLCAWGCERSSSPVDKPAQARQAVQRFFTALPSGDCGELGRLFIAEQPGRECRTIVDEMNHHGLRLDSVLDAEVDGRNASAVIVRVRISEHGKPRQSPLLLRVEQHSDGWKLRL